VDEAVAPTDALEEKTIGAVVEKASIVPGGIATATVISEERTLLAG
jgi:hypothetical protein